MKTGDILFAAQAHNRWTLGRLIGTGGEGDVFEIEGHPKLLAKVYSHDAKPERLSRRMAKLSAMIVLPDLAKSTRLAWPQALGFDKFGAPVGFLMGQVVGVPLTALSAPLLIRKRLPEWNELKALRAVHDLAIIFGNLESRGVLVCDFNFNNFFISPIDGRASLIDCDSYQISGPGGVHTSEVITPEFLSPEALGGTAWKSATQEQMRFGAAILFFMVLFQGWHPFQCAGALSPTENILAGRTAMGVSHGLSNGFWPHPVYSRYLALPPLLKRRFIEALVWGHSDPNRRPNFPQWTTAFCEYADLLKRSS